MDIAKYRMTLNPLACLLEFSKHICPSLTKGICGHKFPMHIPVVETHLDCSAPPSFIEPVGGSHVNGRTATTVAQNYLCVASDGWDYC